VPEEGVLDVADVEDNEERREDDMIEEQMFTFDKFEAVRHHSLTVESCINFDHDRNSLTKISRVHSSFIFLGSKSLSLMRK